MPPASHGAPAGPVNAAQIMRRIRDGLRGIDREQEWKRHGRKAVPPHLISGVQRLKASTALLRSSVSRVGQPPPAPPTLRGRIGLLIVHILRRALFWLIPSIQTAETQIVDALEQHLAATDQILQILQQTNVELARLSQLAATNQNGGGARL